MSEKQTMTIAVGDYDRTRPLIDGRISIPGRLSTYTCPPFETMFSNAFDKGAYEVSELSFSNFVRLTARGSCAYVGLPIFPSRSFRHSAWYIRNGGPIRTPEDLRGKRIGVREYSMTAAVVARGALADETGVRANEIEWVIGDVDVKERDVIVPTPLPSDYKISALRPGSFLVDQLLNGEIDALLAYKPPKAFKAGDTRIVRLYEDYGSREEAFYRRSGMFPIMHLMGVRRDVLENDPGLPMALCDAFAQAKNSALDTLRSEQALGVSLPWLVQEVSRTTALMGPDWWPYGIARNRDTLGSMLRYLHEQGLVERTPTLEEIFHSTTLET
jgi:4,5-dihydroxyphthalate decarboxylase